MHIVLWSKVDRSGCLTRYVINFKSRNEMAWIRFIKEYWYIEHAISVWDI